MIEFKDFGMEDNARYLKYVKCCIQIPAVFAPQVLFSYKEPYQFQRGYAADLCWHKAIDDGAEFWMPPAGDWDEINWQEVFAKHVPPETTFIYVPEYLVKLWQKQLGSAIDVQENRENWDYILYLDRMEKLQGKNFKPFRNAINAFEKNYKYTVEEIAPKIFDELRAFQSSAEENLQTRAEKLEDAQDDDASFLFALEHWDDFKDLFGFVVRVDGKIIAYGLDEQLDETHSVGLFAKADYEFKGANQFAYWYDAKINLERGILTENIMADIGEENLRFFKEHLYPLVMMKKYIVTYIGETEFPTIQMHENHDLKISFERLKKDLTLKLSGKLNTDAADSSKDEILSALDGAEKIIFDLNGLEYISSSGLRILVAAFKKVKAQGGVMTLKNIGEQVREVLDMTGFAQIFNVEA